MKLHAGIPVLYIPGNSGSYKQVRSFGAEAYRGFFGSAFYPSNGLDELLGRDGPEEGKEKNSLDFWTVDFNEELLGLSGQLLEYQIEFVLDCVKEEGETARPLIMFNPEIIASSDEENVYEEGCLSIPDLFADVTRPKTVQVRWIDRDGNEQNEEMDGLWATCVQHEVDHLEGKLFIDHIKPLRRQMITRKMVKLKRELARG